MQFFLVALTPDYYAAHFIQAHSKPQKVYEIIIVIVILKMFVSVAFAV